MSIFFSINEYLNIGLHSGASYCILEGTRSLFDNQYNECLNEIYEGYDIGMSLIILDEANSECYNYFCKKCEAAMWAFPTSEHANNMEKNLVDGIIMKWNELLEVLKKDSRYQPD